MLKQKVDSPWTKNENKTTLPGWNSCRDGIIRCLVLLLLLLLWASRIIQPFLWLHLLQNRIKYRESTQSIWPLFCAGSGKPLGNDGGNGVEQPGLDADGILLQTQRTSFERSSSPVRRGQDCWGNPKQARFLGSSSNPNKEKEWKGSPGEYINTCMIVHKHTMYRKVMWLCVAGHSYSSTKWKQNV